MHALLVVLLLFLVFAQSPATTMLLAGDSAGHKGVVIPAAGKNEEVRRRRAIGSTAPICTINECRACRSSWLQLCKARLVPVDPSDPVNSAYHYRCTCLRNS